MFTSSKKRSSGSVRHSADAAAGGGLDAATPPAQSASSIAALRSARTTVPLALRPRPLPQHRPPLGDDVAAVVEGLDILDGDRPRGLALERLVERDGDVAAVHLGIDRDILLDRD